MSSGGELPEPTDAKTLSRKPTPRYLAPTVRPGPPPLRIHHFLVVTAVAAVLLSVVAGLRRNETAAMIGFFQSGFSVVYTLTTSLAITLVLYGIWWRLEGRAFFDQPGHWLLVERSLAIMTIVLASVVALGDWAEHVLISMWTLIMSLILSGVNLWAAFRVADTWWWRFVFLFGSVMVVVMPWLPGFVAVTTIPAVMVGNSAIAVILLLSAAAADQVASRPRDWPHWVGVFLRVAISIGGLLLNAWWFFTSRRGM
jgi:hypothetical protein